MKPYSLFFTVFLFISCSHASTKKDEAISNNDSLNTIMEKYAPGLGEIMGGIQMHHAKLWYAGINDNWKLAQYEIDELKERFEQARMVETSRPEVKMIPMMYPAIDSINAAIGHKNLIQFKSGFQLLTASCNSCHSANNFEFNIITIPTAPPVSNQDFKVRR
ncbi:hypothetical protein FW778_05325 [Ginsengibacter hankyongi]|uniref:Cytochrome c domain-containing protein n=1 Tax=Ginsengibacter hankyongi TaxID=2607284 RepID=A0A5J5IN70_9BACT|nr:hypothetical protein [Ginsengibacter hankyongi]KAA9041447.1 hypothetical protein FW778_05325 [Ginsengibacter hankyongi]